LLQNAVERANCDVITKMAGNGNDARLIIVFELAVTAFCPDVTPAVVFNHFDNLSNFHTTILHHFELAATSKPRAAAERLNSAAGGRRSEARVEPVTGRLQ
jgi:hypothetical protein